MAYRVHVDFFKIVANGRLVKAGVIEGISGNRRVRVSYDPDYNLPVPLNPQYLNHDLTGRRVFEFDDKELPELFRDFCDLDADDWFGGLYSYVFESSFVERLAAISLSANGRWLNGFVFQAPAELNSALHEAEDAFEREFTERVERHHGKEHLAE